MCRFERNSRLCPLVKIARRKSNPVPTGVLPLDSYSELIYGGKTGILLSFELQIIQEETEGMISTEIKNISNCKKELTITMERDALEPIREDQIKQVRKEVQMPGFRKGKAPIGLIKRSYGDAIEAYTLEAAVDQGLRNSVEENKLAIVGTPEAKKVDFNDNGDLVMVVEVETYPEIELKKYTGLELTKDVYEVTDKLVNDTMERFRKEKAEVTVLDGPAEKGCMMHLDMQDLDDDGKPVSGKKYENITVHLGEGKFDPQLEEQLIGLKADEEKEIAKVYPEDFPQKEYAGKKERYQVKVKNVEREVLPELNDEFVKDLGESFETVEELRKAARENLEHQYQQESENRLSADLSQMLIEENPFDIPSAMVQDYLEHIVEDVKQRDPKLQEEMIRKQYEAEALFSMKWIYLREEIGKKENIEVTEEDEAKFLEELNDDKLREVYKSNAQLMSRVKEDIRNKKIFDFLIENAKITENAITLD